MTGEDCLFWLLGGRRRRLDRKHVTWLATHCGHGVTASQRVRDSRQWSQARPTFRRLALKGDCDEEKLENICRIEGETNSAIHAGRAPTNRKTWKFPVGIKVGLDEV